ncbi:leucine-rich repeat and IQ domain-containing protein 3 [Podarcis raffonei]|uniref:leucine-rich repeat and IQ domain-containing protein 3 n=1 Tax=Podarcis raffonei TaxID=65483 RepID=UPI002329747C|nr:leucine-rich repeat and IQ domain-containing protein 3 [Podarcis raffonei]XP_053248026.1 leucine-rich repeat and IQ domain-containing protein 3 [Podarcis raffonei]XP_053248027.1 leucine-rich repeat and IQ domain-containing protein 3 [Podarcis raffonei]XP_053248029.1 leucine-rich repeat and IQ domain-containing protein 3 [Podarcis raffonei]XP_053248030.1 leucine-rich repeat and IQ domain-containing protein 3 [Podarcis raffonei]XP_053248031.1 leucine-rich repeat and IQ domain-containing prote
MEEEFTKYLVSPSESLLLQYGQTADQKDAKKLRNLVMVRIRTQYLCNLKEMQYCVSLKICDLSGNFIVNIDALESCTNLIKLDLHNNQIEELPGPMFWVNMAGLQLLYLHNNSISALEDVHSLSFCPNLIALTLFNTPLCLKIAYRHIVVNSIFSLKALDYYVISDEEIIEDWRLPEKYKPFTPSFYIDFCPTSGKETTFQEEMEMVKKIISKINYILSFHSPVLIIQKWIRGYLIRKVLCLVPMQDVLRYKRYMRGGLRLPPLGSDRDVKQTALTKMEQHAEIKTHAPGITIKEVKDLKELHLYLRRLKYPIISTLLRLEEKKKMKEKKSKRSPKKEHLGWKEPEVKSDEMAMKFRLSIRRMHFYSLHDELQSCRERDKEIFDAVHDLRYFMQPITPTKPIHEPVSIDKRTFAKAFGAVRLRPLCAIDKAYLESQKLDVELKKERHVMRMQIIKCEVTDYIHRLQENKMEKVQMENEEGKLMTKDTLEEQKNKRSKSINKLRQNYTNFVNIKKKKTFENTFVQRFSTQHLSLTNGLLRMDGWRKNEEFVKERKVVVRGIIEEQKQRREMFENFREERQDMMQRQNTDEKQFRNCVAHEMARERYRQAKAKVEAIKQPRQMALYSLPVIGSSGTAVPVIEYDG